MFNPSFTERQVDSLWDENEYILEGYLERFPKNCIYMRWNYSHPQTYGNLKAMEWYTENELPVMGATAAQTRWKLMPQNESNMENIRAFASTAIEMKDLTNYGFETDDEETHGGEICDPSDEECGCIFPFIPEEYRIFAITLMLIAAILSFVCYDILMIRKRNN